VSDRSGDPIVDRALDELRRLPPVDDLAVRRIVTAAAARRDSAEIEDVGRSGRRGRWPRPWIATGLVAGLAAAAVAGFVLRGAWSPPPSGRQAAAAARAAPPAAANAPSVERIQMAVAPAADAAPIPTQFVLRNAAAHRVSVVGDFNGWNPSGAPLVRSAGGDLWSTTIPVAPGRHTYGFMIDDSVFTLDPRAPKTRDPDLGVEGSVIIVGRP
jgi:hypothetical protein